MRPTCGAGSSKSKAGAPRSPNNSPANTHLAENFSHSRRPPWGRLNAMPSIDEVAEQITAAAVPVLLLDTCILLDIIRSTHRCLQNYAARALELLRLDFDNAARMHRRRLIDRSRRMEQLTFKR